MKFNLLKSVMVVAMLLASGFTNAALMKFTADFTIFIVDGNYATVQENDVFKFSAVYDEQGTHFKQSDALSNCLSTHVPTADVPCDYINLYDAADWSLFSNASMNFEDMFDLNKIVNDGRVFLEFTNENVSNATSQSRYDMIVFRVSNDVIRASFSSLSSIGTAFLVYQIDEGLTKIGKMTTIAYRISNQTFTLVPEPSTLAILALGLIGIGARRFKKQF